MKRFSLVLTLLIICVFAVPTIADDALVFPAGVMRILYYNTTLTGGDEFFNEDGDVVDVGEYMGIPDVDTYEAMEWVNTNIYGIATTPGAYYHQPVAALNISRSDFILDVGVTNKISARFWVPYYFKASTKVEWDPYFNGSEYTWVPLLTGNDLPDNVLADSNSRGIGDIMVGWKHQLIGSNDIERGIRFAYSTGFRLGTAKIWDPVADPNGVQLDDGQMDVGIWTHTDFVWNKNMYINLFTKYENQMPGKHKWDLGTGKAEDVDFEPGNYLYAEIEPHYTVKLKENSNLELMVAFQYEKEEEGKYIIPDEFGGGEVEIPEWEVTTITPTISIENWNRDLVPFEFEAKYTYYYAGKNYPKFDKLQFILKLYTKIF